MKCPNCGKMFELVKENEWYCEDCGIRCKETIFPLGKHLNKRYVLEWKMRKDKNE